MSQTATVRPPRSVPVNVSAGYSMPVLVFVAVSELFRRFDEVVREAVRVASAESPAAARLASVLASTSTVFVSDTGYHNTAASASEVLGLGASSGSSASSSEGESQSLGEVPRLVRAVPVQRGGAGS